LGKTLPRAILLKLVDINFRTGSFEKLEKHGSGKIAEMPGKIAEMPGKIAEKKTYVFDKFSKCVIKTIQDIWNGIVVIRHLF